MYDSVFNLFKVGVFEVSLMVNSSARKKKTSPLESKGDEREEQDCTLPVRSQIGGENGSRWQRESSITAPQGELQLKLL